MNLALSFSNTFHQLILALKSSPGFLLAEWSSVSLLYCNSLKNKGFIVCITFSHAGFTLTEHRKFSDLHFCLHGMKDSAHQSISIWALESQGHRSPGKVSPIMCTWMSSLYLNLLLSSYLPRLWCMRLDRDQTYSYIRLNYFLFIPAI